MTGPSPSLAERAPYLGLEEALHASVAIQEQGGGSVTVETLSPILGNSTKSSSFTRKLAALRAYGLVELNGDRISVSRMGLAYVAPTSEEEKAEVPLLALRKIPLARALHDRYGGGVLPSRDVLANVLLREYNAPDPNHTAWADFFLAALRTAGLLAHVGGKATVLTRPAAARERAETPTAPDRAAPARASSEPQRSGNAGPSGDVTRVEFPLADGSMATVILPKRVTPDDIDDVIATLEVIKKRAKRQLLLHDVLGGDNG